MKEIELTQGKVAIVDDKDYEFLNKWSWFYDGRYAVRSATMSDGTQRRIFMHKLIVLNHRDREADHINGDKLDNRSENLRACTRNQNQHNIGMQSNNTAGYKGVCKTKEGNWQAQISSYGERVYLGVFPTSKEAALAYNKKAVELHGEFAWLNQI